MDLPIRKDLSKEATKITTTPTTIEHPALLFCHVYIYIYYNYIPTTNMNLVNWIDHVKSVLRNISVVDAGFNALF